MHWCVHSVMSLAIVGPDKTCRNETLCGIDAGMAIGVNVMENLPLELNGNEWTNVFVDTSPKSESCGERGIAVMCRDGRLCKADIWTGMSAVLWQCQCKKAEEERTKWRWQARKWLLKVFLPWLAWMAMKVCLPPHFDGRGKVYTNVIVNSERKDHWHC